LTSLFFDDINFSGKVEEKTIGGVLRCHLSQLFPMKFEPFPESVFKQEKDARRGSWGGIKR
jgi:hypothetical protein